MNSRRDILIGAGCFATAAVAYELVPRRRVQLLRPGQKVADIIPRTFGGWTSQDVSDVFAPKTDDDLASKLYGETVGRVYSRSGAGDGVMMFLAYGDTQSDDLQLHRPEICFPAFGYAITQSAVVNIPLAGGVTVPTRRLIADSPEQRQSILYWTRLGQFLPLDKKQQQIDRLRTALKGEISDGLLARFSVSGSDAGRSFAILNAFIPDMLKAVGAASRDVLIGSQRAQTLAHVMF